MKNKLWITCGRFLYLFTLPGIILVVRLSPSRTRIVLISDNKILLLKDWLGNGQWKLPGGGLHKNEDPIQGAVREVKEETGIDIKSQELNKIGIIKIRNKFSTVFIHAYFAKIKTTKTNDYKTFEISEAEWVNISDLVNIKISNTTTLVLQAYNKTHPWDNAQ